MRGRNHLVVGMATVALVEGALPFLRAHSMWGIMLDGRWLMIPALGCAAAGALLPDIDLATSLISHETGTGRGQGCLTGFFFQWIRKLLGGHRGLTHSLWVCLACLFVFGLDVGALQLGDFRLPLGWTGLFGRWSDLGTAFTLGYLSHVLADTLTRDGVKLGYPFWRSEIGLGPRAIRFANGSWVEHVWVVIWVAVALWLWIL
jgi:membrane-bound metal-dependent hydrolase YbcI (DUF457 family)